MAAKIHVNTLKILTGHTSAVYALAPSGDGGFYSAGGDGMVVKWPENGSDGVLFARIPDNVYSLFFSFQRNSLFAGTRSGDLFEINVAGQVRRLQAHHHGLYAMAENNGKLITTGGDGKLIIWNAALEIEKIVQVSEKSCRGLFHGENHWWTGSSDFMIRKYNQQFELMSVSEGHSGSVFTIAGLPDGRIVSGGRDAVLRIWSQSGELLETISAHLLHIHDIQLSPDCGLLATSGMDKTIKIWNPQNMELLKVIDAGKMEAHTSSVNKLLWLKNNVLVSAGDDRKVMVFELN